MKVLLESTTQTHEIVPPAYTNDERAVVAGVPARLWQGHVVDIDHGELYGQLSELSNSLAIVSNEVKHGVTPAHELVQCAQHISQQLHDIATMLDEARGGIAVHAFITRIAHPESSPPHVHERFARELQVHAPPRSEYVAAYSLRLFI